MAKPKPTVSTEIIPYIFYRDVPAALGWLTRSFGFAETMRTATPNGGTHAEMTLDGQRIMMGQGSKEWRMMSAHAAEAATQGIFIYLADVEAHCERARAAGAEIVKPLEDLPYGRSCTACDPDGHPWFFTTPPAER
ncbi:MAG: VOC family protein [Methylocella sp.]